MLVVAGEVEDGVAQHHVGEVIGKRYRFDPGETKVIRGKRWREVGGQLAHVLDGLRVGVHAKYFVSLPEKIDQVAAASESRIEDAHSRRDAAAQDLVEEINVDLPELLWKADCHVGSRPVYRHMECDGLTPPW